MIVLAVWLHLTFTTPRSQAPLASYQCRANDATGYAWLPRLYSAPFPTAGPPVPKRAAGDSEHVYVSLSQDQRWRMYRVAAVDSNSKIAEWSNGVIAVAGLGDTLWSCPPGTHWQRTQGGRLWWTLTMAQTPGAEALSWDELQERDRAAICQCSRREPGPPEWFYRGRMVPCP